MKRDKNIEIVYILIVMTYDLWFMNVIKYGEDLYYLNIFIVYRIYGDGIIWLKVITTFI